MTPQEKRPKLKSAERWQKVARRIRVPLGFLTAALYLFELWRREPRPAAVAWSLLLVLPGLWLRAYAVRLCQKESRTHPDRALRVHPQPALPGIDSHCRGICGCFAQLARGSDAGSHVSDHLCAGHRLGRAVFAVTFPRFRCILPVEFHGFCRALPPLLHLRAKPKFHPASSLLTFT